MNGAEFFKFRSGDSCWANKKSGHQSWARQHLSSSTARPKSSSFTAVVPGPHHFVPNYYYFFLLFFFIQNLRFNQPGYMSPPAAPTNLILKNTNKKIVKAEKILIIEIPYDDILFSRAILTQMLSSSKLIHYWVIFKASF